MKQLSIIVPIYKVEKYIRRCLESIFRQGLNDDVFEVIIVNDGTPDRSMEVIADIIQQHQNITVINQENQGLSVARNNGIEQARGEYILFIDSDDLLIDNTLPYLLDKALSSQADLVVADFVKMCDEQIAQFDHNQGDRLFDVNLFNQKPVPLIVQDKSGRELLIQDLNPWQCYVWRTLYQREFLNRNHLRFIPHICYEDIPFTHQCYVKADRCLRVNWQFIIYRKGHESITKGFTTQKAKDYCEAIASTWALSHDKALDDAVRQKIRNDAFVSFSMLFYVLTSSKTISRSEKMSVLIYIKRLIPDLSFKNGLKQHIVNLLYHKVPYTYLTLRIFYARYLQTICWTIGDFVRNKKN